MTMDPEPFRPTEMTAGRILPDEFVRALLLERSPEHANLPFGRRYTDMEEHFSVRLGDELIIELPRQRRLPSWDPVAMDHLHAAAQDWDFRARLPIVICEPALGYPHRFEIARWFDASTAIRSPLRTEAARDLGRALAQVHERPTRGAPLHEATGGSLITRSGQTYERLAQSSTLRSPEGAGVIPERIRRAWDDAVAVPPALERTWITGTLDPRAVMAKDGEFAGLVYWREHSVGDPINELGIATLLFGPEGVDLLLDGYGHDGAELRVQMKAIATKRALLYIHSDNPAIARLGWTRLQQMGMLTDPTQE
ncbi:phosphotransferase [Demequina capsici]|uniref:Phosphotransferase n=1 Tax=Demequina capsici TaxID=3075620 RepID=A0AA96F6P2_9MICO|nr:phosphotransferase [Demequina sp. OYTSA14]WNM24624.1 phosphotransferase [Demequina sp. OYTSA14]